MKKEPIASYDCAIIGGGLGGLCLAIQLADAGMRVILFERHEYPFHKVCGEYVSMESWGFLTGLGLPLGEMLLPRIQNLRISAEDGYMLHHKLDMGGFGVSRYTLDHRLSELAEARGVTLMANTKVTDVEMVGTDEYRIGTTRGSYQARFVCGSYGKYKPSFINDFGHAVELASGNNWIGVKYHIRTDIPDDQIELHNFQDGYCGISRVEDGIACLCYLTTAKNLIASGKDIKQLEKNILFKNRYLKKYFTTAAFVRDEPLVISNVQFGKRDSQSDGLFLLGDAAGSITPLCGNGMSMAMRASKLLAQQLICCHQGQIASVDALLAYEREWNQAFWVRVSAGYYLQSLFGKRRTTAMALRFLHKTPWLMRRLVALTHGAAF